MACRVNDHPDKTNDHVVDDQIYALIINLTDDLSVILDYIVQVANEVLSVQGLCDSSEMSWLQHAQLGFVVFCTLLLVIYM